MRSLLISLQSEYYKSRKTLAFWAAILLPVLICGLITLGFLSNSAKIIKMNYPPEVLWLTYSGTALGVMGMLILPFYVIFIAFSVNNIEHKNDTWKTLFAQPLNKFGIYAAKYLYAVILIFLTLFLFVVLTYLFGNILHLINNKFRFNEFSPLSLLSKLYFKLFLSSLGILSLQFIISLIWADFLKPMGIGFIGIIMGIIVASKGWEYAYLVPYSHPTLALSMSKAQNSQEIFTKDIYSSLAFALAFFIGGYFIVSQKSIK
ncbi:MAG: ABC transporter permease [Bacteroidota bacterium]